jgi:hypothetical protein
MVAEIVHETRAGNHVIELLMRQTSLYEQLRELCAKQRDLIELNQTENLLQVLRSRQLIMNALKQVQTELAPLRGNWQMACTDLSSSDRELVSTLIERARGDVQAILDSDRQDTAMLSARKQTVARELRDLSGTRTAGTAYAQISSGSGANSADLTG